MPHCPAKAAPLPEACTRFLVAVLPGFSFLSLGSILEPLRYLRDILPEGEMDLEVYHLQSGIDPARDLVDLRCDRGFGALEARIGARPVPDAVFLCCGFDIPMDTREPFRRILRQLRRAGIPIFSIGAATWALAELGLLPDGRGAVHWAALPAFRERNHHTQPLPKLFHLAPKVSTCAGELAALDLIVHYIRDRFGGGLADRICDRFLVSRPRGPETDQPAHTSSLLRYAPQVVLDTAARMSEALENPMAIRDLARHGGISQRQLERVFKKYLRCSPRQYYKELQLGLAWQLCEQTDMPLVNVAFASGFGSHSNLSRHFRKRYSLSPSELRAKTRGS